MRSKSVRCSTSIREGVPMTRFCVASILFLSAGIALAQTASAQPANASKPSPPPVMKSFDLSAIDKTTDPCTDFYRYACANWLKTNPMPADQTRWLRSFSTIEERNRYLLWEELDAAAKAPKTPLQKQYGDYYAACMDTSVAEKKGFAPVLPVWVLIAQLADAKQIPSLLGRLENDGTPDGFFNFFVAQDDKDSSRQIAQIFQGGLSLPDRDYYIVDDAHFKEIRQKYLDHMKKMFALAGDT